MPRHRFQIRPRTILLSFVVFSILFCYVGTYYRLSRRGMAEMHPGPNSYWLFVPAAEVADGYKHDRWDFTDRHDRYLRFFAPLIWVDVELFGNPPPWRGGIWKLK